MMGSYITFAIIAVAAAVTSIFYDAFRENGRSFELGGALGVIDRVANLSLEDFDKKYNGQWPVIITDVIGNWRASHWTESYFLKNFPDEHVTLKSVQGKLHDATSSYTTLEHFVTMKKAAGSSDRWLYVEDEIFIPRRPKLQSDIGESIYTHDDLFKVFKKEIRPWDAMMLWGTPFSRSALHIDPYNWTGTNAVIWGRKRWMLYPPGQDDLLYAKTNLNSGFPLNCHTYGSPVDAFDPDLERYPRFSQARALQVEQRPGELLIIPTGWFHQAFNVKETFAISGQIMNNANFRIVLEEIAKAGHFPDSRIPDFFEELSPTEQVRAAMSMIPEHVLEKGRKVIEIVLSHLNQQASMADHYAK